MEGYDASTYGERWADVYDDWYPDVTDTAACVEALAALAASGPPGPVLELGVGTGRLAIPLAERGLDVRGIDSSPAMLERLHAKPGAPAVLAVAGDMAAPHLPSRPADPPDLRCGLAFVAYNTLFNLTDPDAQRRCVAEVARLLAPGGRFVVEAFVPAPDTTTTADDTPPRSTVSVRTITADRLVLAADVVDPVAQTVRGQYVDITEGGIRLRPFHVRYLRPDQLDELAASCGLTLEDRWGDWRRRPFGPDHSAHVSIYRAPTAAP